MYQSNKLAHTAATGANMSQFQRFENVLTSNIYYSLICSFIR